MALLSPLARTYPTGVTSWIETRQPDVDAAIEATVDPDIRQRQASAPGGQVLRSGEDDWTRHSLVRDPGGATCTASQFSPVSY